MFSKPRLVYVKLFGNSESRCNKNLFIFLFLVAEPSNVAEKKQKNKKNLFRRFGTIHKLWLLRDFSAVENSYTALLDNIIYMYRNYHFVFQSHLQQIVCVCVCVTPSGDDAVHIVRALLPRVCWNFVFRVRMLPGSIWIVLHDISVRLNISREK